MDNGTVAGLRWKSQRAEMLLSFEQEALNTLHSLFRTSDKYGSGLVGASADEIGKLLDQGFAELVHEGTIEPVRPFSTVGAQQYEALLAANPVEAA
jgi:hypothetical protein